MLGFAARIRFCFPLHASVLQQDLCSGFGCRPQDLRSHLRIQFWFQLVDFLPSLLPTASPVVVLRSIFRLPVLTSVFAACGHNSDFARSVVREEGLGALVYGGFRDLLSS
jgi:hypothetical protein